MLLLSQGCHHPADWTLVYEGVHGTQTLCASSLGTGGATCLLQLVVGAGGCAERLALRVDLSTGVVHTGLQLPCTPLEGAQVEAEYATSTDASLTFGGSSGTIR